MRIFKHLTFTDRLKIEFMIKEKMTKKQIADVLRVHVSTIYRELEKGKYTHLNTDYTTETRYSPDIAEQNYRANLDAKGADLKIGKDYKLAEFIENTIIEKQYSPDAALGEIKKNGLQFSTSICRTTLYSYIGKGVFLRLTNSNLPRKGYKKRPYKMVRAARAPRGESIEKRPDEINTRESFGHWEMDTVIGCRGSHKTLLVLTERLTRKEIIVRMRDKTAASVVRALNVIEKKYGALFAHVFKSITVDNGTEFSDCTGMESSCRNNKKRTKLYYCHPYSAYERGSNENQNGMIRRRLPKGTNFDKVSNAEVQNVEDWLNDYPRAMFDYQSSNDIYIEELKLLA